MRSSTPPTADTQRQESFGTTIRVTDYQTRPATRTSWTEVQIHREEIRLPHRPDERR